MIINIIRTHITPRIADGSIYINHEKICDTIESGPHRLPAGTYQLFPRKNRLLGMDIPAVCPLEEDPNELQSTIDPSSTTEAWITAGNGAYALKGPTIIVGESCFPGVVIHSMKALTTLCKKLRLRRRHVRKVLITITEK